MKIKTITLWQPWATLIALGEKKYETRSWSTNHRGLLAIHAAKRKPEEFAEAGKILADYGIYKWSELPRGRVVAVARLTHCFSTTHAHDLISNLPSNERAFGDFSIGRFAWRLTDVIEIPTPFPARGYQGLWQWDVPEEVQALLSRSRIAHD